MLGSSQQYVCFPDERLWQEYRLTHLALLFGIDWREHGNQYSYAALISDVALAAPN